jgi:cyclic 2,3-diphosphoglycerate synthetase
VPAQPVIALIDGEHHPAAVREALDALADSRELAGVVFCGGEEKAGPEALRDPEAHYGRPLERGADPVESLRRLAANGAGAVVDLADEPVLAGADRMRLAAHALHLGLDYEAPGMHLRSPRYERVSMDGPVLAVIGTGKRTGKTAVAGHWARLLRSQRDTSPVIVCMGRGGPGEPRLAHADTSLEDLEALAAQGQHAASDYLEDAVLAGVISVGCRRVGGGPAGVPSSSNVAQGAALAASLDPGALILEGSGASVPPVEADRTVCVVGSRTGALEDLGPYRILRADLALVIDAADAELAADVAAVCPGDVLRCELRTEACDPVPDGARVGLFTTGAESCDGVEPVVRSTNLARRAELESDLDRAAAEGCDLYLTELKAAAIELVAARARVEGARVGFLRNVPVAHHGSDLDAALLAQFDDV